MALSSCILPRARQQLPCMEKIYIGFVYLIHGFVIRTATAATISWKVTRQLQRKQQVIEALRLANVSFKYAAPRQPLSITKFMTFYHSLCQNACRLRCCRLLCVAVATFLVVVFPILHPMTARSSLTWVKVSKSRGNKVIKSMRYR